MNLNLLVNTRRRLLVLALAAVLALSASYASIVLDGAVGTSFTTTTFACSHPSGGC